ncbi:hypothetical protein T265_05360 [Opisthorchis viverrini]|uniref:Uncharacterized protein n=1 Tax=Opisthorchis viverrini TaxID=6198 RepID=A0A074ZKT2_OPIVI|nr:hypothetical protein T265_05360 [Opisthorchis viverrini]KER27641.1 hypothetical protein T265_05360 [Opisthorchis viverrini]
MFIDLMRVDKSGILKRAAASNDASEVRNAPSRQGKEALRQEEQYANYNSSNLKVSPDSAHLGSQKRLEFVASCSRCIQ